MNRREARKQAFLLLFQYKFQPGEVEGLLNNLLAEIKAGTQTEYIKETVLGTVERVQEIDDLLAKHSNDWKVDRISSVSLAVLRLGVYEMLYMDDIPAAVSVNEAVALAKEYEGEEAAPFVNGILGKIKESVSKG